MVCRWVKETSLANLGRSCCCKRVTSDLTYLGGDVMVDMFCTHGPEEGFALPFWVLPQGVGRALPFLRGCGCAHVNSMCLLRISTTPNREV